ncbi:TIM barrel protein [Rubinisphaera sp. JC750]|uniref:TIM barrel protein n=1 Tax=Rubinisphaera sp. JC750 TaxID=2898658 RepID=UPI001F4669C6|nr:TIM barrel protein [Rubinisphaera sp. JC750]
MTPPETSISRRDFLSTLAVAGAATAFTGSSSLFAAAEPSARSFRMNFAPHPGSFRASAGNDVLDQIRFAHDQGFTAWEHNQMPKEDPAMQEKIGKLLSDLNMKMGVFVAYGDFNRPTFAVRKKEYRDTVLQSMKESIAIAERCGAKYVTVVPGTVDQQYKEAEKWNNYGGPRLSEGYQTANVIDLLRECADIVEPHDIVMVLEPLNWHANHGGLFLERSDQAYAICRAVNSPSCKILFDIYHQQITEGNLIPNIDLSWNEIAYFQAGDNPGRKEPGTGEINYSNVFQHIHDRAQSEGRDFIIGMEHGNSIKGKEGEEALIAAYRAVEPQ